MWVSVTSRGRLEDLDVEAIWRDLHVRLLAFIDRRVSDRGSAEDILQEVMLRIHRHAGEVRDGSAVVGWIHQITRNAIVDHYRRSAVRRERPTGLDTDLDRPAPPLPEPDLRTELATCLAPLLSQLPAVYRDALEVVDLQGKTQIEAAALVGLSASGMKTRVQRARVQLKELFARCCEIELDRRGGIIDYRPLHGACDCPTRPPAPGSS